MSIESTPYRADGKVPITRFPESTPDLPVFPRGFLITGTAEAALPETYRRVQLSPRWFYWHDHLTEPTIAQNHDAFLVIHGLCVDIKEERAEDLPELLLSLALHDEQAFLDRLDHLNGRWVLLVSVDGQAVRIFHDALGMRSVYWCPVTREAASHVKMLGQLSNLPSIPKNQLFRKPTALFDRTLYQNVYALLPNHTVTLDDRASEEIAPVRYWPRADNPYRYLTHDGRMQRITRLWEITLERIEEQGRELVLSLSGGADSRTNLAMSRGIVGRLRAFTYGPRTPQNTRWSRIMGVDMRVAGQLVRMTGLDHTFMHREHSGATENHQLAERIDLATTFNHGKWLIPLYREFASGPTAIHLRASIFEIGRTYYHQPRDRGDLGDIWRIFRLLTPERTDAQKRAFFDEAVRRQQLSPEQYPGYLPSDISYWEMRSGRWFCETLNESDFAFETVVPINCREIIMLLLAYPLNERSTGFVFHELINGAWPELNFVGQNTAQNLYQQLRSGLNPFPPIPSAEDCVTLYTPHGAVLRRTVVEPRNFMSIPLSYFRAGVEVRKEYRVPPDVRQGIAQWEAPYARPAGSGNFEYRVLLDGQEVWRDDGALRAGPYTVKLAEVCPGQMLEICIRAIRNQNRVSWEHATAMSSISIQWDAEP